MTARGDTVTRSHERKLRVKDQEEMRLISDASSSPSYLARSRARRTHFREIRRGSSIMNSLARRPSSSPRLLCHARAHFSRYFPLRYHRILLSNCVMCSLRRDDCARLAAPVSGTRAPAVSRLAVKRLRKTSKMNRRFFRGASKATEEEILRSARHVVAAEAAAFANEPRLTCSVTKAEEKK